MEFSKDVSSWENAFSCFTHLDLSKCPSQYRSG
jgi:hypothetical protein